MTRFIYSVIIAAFSLTVAACSQKATEGVECGVSQITITLPSTRTCLGDKVGEYYPTYWSEEDVVVANGTPSTSLTIGEDRISATLHFDNEAIVAPFRITYPYSEGSLCSAERPTVLFSEEQHYAEKSFGVGYAPMCGYSDGNGNATLKHLAGVMHLAIMGSTTLAKIEITAPSDAALSGEFDVDCQAGTIAPIEGKTTNKIRYIVEEALSSSSAKSFFIALPAGNYGKCEVVITDKEGSTMNLSWNGAIVKSGVVREFKPFTFRRNASLELEGMVIEGDDLIIDTPDGPTVVKPEDPDSLAFIWAKRKNLNLSSAEGYVISTEIFDSAQNISVVKLSPAKHTIKAVLPANVTKVSEMGASLGADYGLNGCYWNTSTGQPTGLIKINGELLWNRTSTGLIPRVNGLLFIFDDHIEIMESYEHPYFTTAIEGKDNVLSCGPMLMDEGLVIPYDEFLSQTDAADNVMSMISFFNTRHPRTIIGKDKHNNIYFVVVDGRSSGNAEGMSIQELQKICLWMGMTDAMNLDGGGSSTLWNRELGVINYPCDNKKFDHEGERAVLTSIYAIERE